MHSFLKFIFGTDLCMFWAVSLSVIRSLVLYTQQQVYVTQVLLTACQRDHPLASSQHNLYDIYLLLCVQYQIPDDRQRICLKHAEVYSKNKFEKSVHLVGFIIRIRIILPLFLPSSHLCFMQILFKTCCSWKTAMKNIRHDMYFSA